jgi:hypothetical protein
VGAEIDDDIEDRPGCASHDLDFLVRRGLVVQTSERTRAGIEGHAALSDSRFESPFRELPLAPRPSKEPSFVGNGLDVDDERSSERHFRKDHPESPATQKQAPRQAPTRNFFCAWRLIDDADLGL